MVECMVLAGEEGKFVQGVLFLFCCASLLFKYWRNHGGRSIQEFGLDSSKQLCGAAWIHVLNLVFAEKLEEQFESSGDQCDWYWLNIVIDTTLGVGVSYSVLMLFSLVIRSCLPEAQAKDFESGQYKNPDGTLHMGKYVKQVMLWLLTVSIMKMTMVGLMVIGHSFLIVVAGFVLSPFDQEDSFTYKLLAVMVVTPVIMNTLQFWVTDNIIKKKDAVDPKYSALSDGNKVHDGTGKVAAGTAAAPADSSVQAFLCCSRTSNPPTNTM
eukprot:TRINITY_DN80961_c0_g1_i1.p1 TRINITY_DN80961_c0_g1~~TRINITY_DN80961_c0_g1_i1.p1  ORF type:complete len:267 (-),score=69.29 TRINITY_DN80961_c0_g1_i1:174-974(-)